MTKTKRTEIPPIITIDLPRNDRRIYGSGSSSNEYCDLIAIISASTHKPNVPKKTTVSSRSI